MKLTFWSMAAAGLISANILGQENPAPAAEDQGFVSLERLLNQKIAEPEAGPKANLESPSETSRISIFQKASSFIGLEVKNQEGETMGEISDMVFDPESGRIGYVVLALTSGGDARNVAVPLSAVKPEPQARHLVLHMSEPLLAAAPAILENDFPPVDAFVVGDAKEAMGGAASGEQGTATSEPDLPKRTRSAKITRDGAGRT